MKKLDDLLKIPPEKWTESQKWQIHFLFIADYIHFYLADSLYLFKARVWNAGVLLWWYRLWIRPDEFDISLSLDDIAYYAMSEKRREWYDEDLAVRRRIAHSRDMRRMTYGWRSILRDLASHIVPSAEYRIARSDVDGLSAREVLGGMDSLMAKLSRMK